MTNKKTIFVLLASAMLCSVCGCTADRSTAETTNQASKPEITGTDYTVMPALVYDISGKEIADTVERYPETAISSTLEDLSEYASLIVSGEIAELYYTSIDGDAWMQMDVLLTSCESGALEAGDRISVYASGGYIPCSEHFDEDIIDDYYSDVPQDVLESTILQCLNEGAPLPEKGEEYLFFLVPASGSRPDGTYELLTGYSGSMFQIDGDTFTNDHTGETFQLNALDAAVLAKADDAAAAE